MFASKLLNFFKRSNPVAQQAEEASPIRAREILTNAREGLLHEYSDTWIFVSNWAKAELDRAREQNDSQKRDAVQTAALRGRIAVLKDLLELPRPKDRRSRSPDE